ncbi:uncharacterized protein Pyn_16105 [Prunus yedoensis var. nudiflora]|uniref:Uncharacterized protein n=1 Tax=Prunus yedoensis var. nudiflora TaxID=2094558 RepID=A0A314XR80_PRUYE|nr:uncharacterized protein Pyn_16105 [Prunus yedoensis var. nudiflora]
MVGNYCNGVGTSRSVANRARSRLTKCFPYPVSRGPLTYCSLVKRRADEQLPRDSDKRWAEGEPRRDTEKRPISSASTEGPRRASVDPISSPLEPWMDGEVALGAYQEAVRRVLKVNVVEGLFTEEMDYIGMTMSALENQLKVASLAAHCEFDRGKRDGQAVTVAELKRTVGEKAKVEEELEQMRGRLEEEVKRNAELSSSLGKLWDKKRGLGRELSAAQKNLDEAKQKIEAFTSELRTSYDDSMKDFMDSSEYHEKLAGQRVEGYFDLVEKVGEKYPSLDWSFLIGEAEETEAERIQTKDLDPFGLGILILSTPQRALQQTHNKNQPNNSNQPINYCH